MGRIPDETIEQVRDSADILGIISETVNLKRTGTDYRGPCPFHGGTHRNFSVSTKRSSYYCFVCHEKGDVFSYFMKRFGMDYPTAIREVARRTGIVIPEASSEAAPDPREPLYEALAAAQDWYSRQLIEDRAAIPAREYLEGRGIAINTAGELELGFSSSSKNFLAAMNALGIDQNRLLEAGLIVKREDGTIAPRFRSRLMFPIHDLRGRVVGFGGRLIGPGEPKYLNSPESPVFRKGTLLYNLHIAKHAVRKEQSAIVVEGYFDAIRLMLAGVENVVAPLGTAMTPDQGALLGRFAKTVTLLYDSDQAGLRATFRAGDELLRHSIRVSVATIPVGEDPDSLVLKHGKEGLEALLADSLDLMELKIRMLRQHGWLEGVDHRRTALDKLLPTIRAAKDGLTRDMYIGLVAECTGVSREAIQKEIDFSPSLPPPSHQSTVISGSRKGDGEPDSWRRRGAKRERDLLHILLTYPTWLERAVSEVRSEWFRGTEFNEIFTSLVTSLTSTDSDFADEKLSARAQLALATLRNSEAFLGMNIDDAYVESCSELEARPLIERFEEYRLKMAAERSIDKRIELYSEAIRLSDEIRADHPFPWQKHVYRKGLRVPQVKPSQSALPPAAQAERNVS